MKFIIKPQERENIVNLMRKVQYHYIGFSDNKELSFVRTIGSGLYPRFHIYLKESKETNEINFNIHLDQRKPVYKGTTAHGGEYDGKIIEEEVKRIKRILE